MITKELFIEVLGLIKEQHEIDSKVADGLELVCDGYVVYGCKNKCHDALRKVLESIFDDRTVPRAVLCFDLQKQKHLDC